MRPPDQQRSAADPAASEAPVIASFAGRAPGAAVAAGARILERGGARSPRPEAETLLRSVLGVDRAGLYVRRAGLTEDEAGAFVAMLERRRAGEPLQHVTGRVDFLGLDLEVEPGVFVPRPETEGLVNVALDVLTGRRAPSVVDVGTGTGAIALAIARARPDARVAATDRAPAAVSLARRNAERLGLAVDVRAGDLLDPVPEDLHGGLDMIVSNPPYLDPADAAKLPAEVLADPPEALFGGTEVHGRLVEAAGRWLAPGGWLVVEIGDRQGPEVRGRFAANLEDVRIVPDLAGRDRVAVGRRP
jgi:release factor glutamine methyltransferase